MTHEFSKNLGESGREQTIHDVSVVSSQNVTFNQTQIIQISVEEVKTRKFIITSPYKGLKKFESEDKDRFFGRDQFLTGLVNELEQTNFVLLLGASGSGKSSVIRAGLIPWLAERQGSHFVNLVFTPDQDPFESLYASLLGKYKQSEAQIARIAKEDTLTQLVRSLKQEDDYWFILIDQFEELFTTTESSKRDVSIKSLVQLVKALNKSGDRSVKLVATMRADFLDRLSPYPDLIKVTDRHRPMIAEMQLDELRLAIEQPAAHHGVVFETGLVKQIIDDVQGQAGYLPLLQYTLNLLWETEVHNQGIEDRTLNISNYRKLGGVRGALQQHVEQIYQSLSESEKLAAQRIFLKLVGIGEDEESGTEWKPVRRRATRSEFSDSLEQTVLTQLVNQNLLVSNRVTDSQESTIEIAHEALLTSWVTLNTWIKENRQAIALRNRLNDDVEQWKKTNSHEDLWSGSRLEQALELRKDETFNQILGGLSQEANQFLDASQGERDRIQKEKVRLQRRAIQWLSGGLVVAVLFALAAAYQWQKAERQTRMAQLQTKIVLANNLLPKEPTRAAVLSIYATGQSVAEYKNVLSSAENSLLASVQGAREENVFEGHQGAVLSVAMSPDGQKIASAGADGTVRIWTLSNYNGQVIDDFQGTQATSVVFNRNGTLLAIADINGNIKIRKLQDNSLVCNYQGEPKEKANGNEYYSRTVLAFNPQNENLLTSAGPDNKVRLFNIAYCDSKVIDTLEYAEKYATNFHAGTIYPSVTSIAFSHDGNLLVIGDSVSGLRLLNLSDKTQQTLLEGRPGYAESIQSLAFDSYFITIGIGVHEMLEYASGRIIRTLTRDERGAWTEEKALNVHQNIARAVVINPDTKQIVSGGDERGDGNNLILLDPWTHNIVFAFVGHKGTVNAISLSKDGKNLVSGGSDGTVRLWSMKSISTDVATLFQEQPNHQLEFWDFSGRKLKLRQKGNAIEQEVEETQNPSLSDYTSIFYSSDGDSMAIVQHDPKRFNETENNFNSFKNLIQIKAKQGNAQLGEFEVIGKVEFVALSSNTKKVVIIKPDEIEIRDFQGKPLTIFINDGQIDIAAISPDGRTIAAAKKREPGDVTRPPLQLFDINGQPIGKFEQEGGVDFLAFSRNSQYILTSKYGEIHFFPANWQAFLKIACNRLRYHPVLNDPETLAQDEIARGARETCQKYSPDWQTK
ncbi:NACHT and WD repeat domain-containing protein [Microcystis protocystis FBCC-A270]|uniref:NACHT and WD repeat domain-containing protein n=1 Tax=Microcystis protocystis TaxID=629747 RepID=UPI003D2BA355